MKLSRVVATRLAAVTLLLSVPCAAAAQNAPKLSKAQRTTLEAVVAAVDQAQEVGAVTPATWQSHVLRASDGSHYVALRATVIDVPVPIGGAMLYVRLAARRSDDRTESARSAVMEWLKGLRGDPLPMRAARSTTVNAGEMPIGGTAASVGDVTADASAALRLGDLQRERERRQREDDSARRRAELERPQPPPMPLYPFEDFDPNPPLHAAAAGGLHLVRGVTAAPGDYDVFIAWAGTPSRGRPDVSVVRRRLTLPPIGPAFGLGDVVVAGAVTPLSAPYPASQQAAHPYAFGGVEVVPAPDNRLTNDGTLGLVYQVLNPSASAAGKPDVEVSFDVFRMVGGRAEVFGHLEAQRHGPATLPTNFDVALGHPLFGAVRAPLAGFPRGRYRLNVTAVDRLAGRRVVTEVALEIVGAPASLLREAPAQGFPFRREALLGPGALAAIMRALRPPSPSPALARALAAAEAGRFAELLGLEVPEPAERPVALVLFGLGLYGLGDSPRAVAAQLTQAAAQGAPAAAVGLLLGGTHALMRDDLAAVAAWTASRESGTPDAVVAPLLVDAYLRRQDVTQAALMATAALDADPGDRSARRALAATLIATRRFAEAIAVLDTAPSPDGPDADSDFLRLHALFAAHVLRTGLPDLRSRFEPLAAAYIAYGGPHELLVRDWLAVVQAQR